MVKLNTPTVKDTKKAVKQRKGFKSRELIIRDCRGKFTFDFIKEYTTSISEQLAEAGKTGTFTVAINHKDEWKSIPYTFKIGDSVEWEILAEEDTLMDSFDRFITVQYRKNVEFDIHFSRFVMYITKDKKAMGASSKYNDCVYECLKNAGVIMPWSHPKELKEYLEIKRCDKVDIKHFSRIEDALSKYAVFVTGPTAESSYVSKKKADYKIYLKNDDGHCKLDMSKKVVTQKYFNELPLKVVNKKGNHVYMYDGETHDTMEAKDFFEIRRGKMTSRWVNVDAKFNSVNKALTMEEINEKYYDFLIKTADTLKAETHGKINMYKTGGFEDSGLNLMCKMSMAVQHDELGAVEGKFLNEAVFSPYIYSEKYEGEGYLYDFIAYYLSIMSSRYYKYPTSAGEFKKLNKKEVDDIEQRGRCSYGIYRCVINDNKKTKEFMANFRSSYTHIDILRAHQLGYTIKILDEDTNALVYNGRFASGNYCFGEYADYIFDLKKRGVVGAKNLCSASYGKWLQKKKNYTSIDVMKDGFYYPEGHAEISREIIGEHKMIITTHKENEFFKVPFARFGPFLLAYARKKMYDTMTKLTTLDNIVRIATDGFISKVKLDIEESEEMGALKYKGYCKECFVGNFQNRTKEENFIK